MSTATTMKKGVHTEMAGFPTTEADIVAMSMVEEEVLISNAMEVVGSIGTIRTITAAIAKIELLKISEIRRPIIGNRMS